MTNAKLQQNVNNIAAERATLAGLCLHGEEAFAEVRSLLTEDCFTVEENKIMFACVQHALKTQKNVDFSTLLASAESLKLTEFVNTSETMRHFESIFNTPAKIDTVYGNAATLRKLHFARQLQNTSRDIFRAVSNVDGTESISEILSFAEAPLQELSSGYLMDDNNLPDLLGDGVDTYLQHLIENPCEQVGLSTGMRAFDKALGGGLARKCVDVVGARPGAGKSLFADHVACHNASQSIPVLMLDTEMDDKDHWNRILANLSSVEIGEIKTGKFGRDPSIIAKVQSGADQLKAMPYHYLNVSGKEFDEIVSIMRRWVLTKVGLDENGNTNDCLIIFDYLKLMTSDSISNSVAEFQALGFQITALHNFCVEFDVPCLTFVQLNRDGITKESTDAASGSDRIIWLCTSFSIFKEKTPEEIATDSHDAGNMKLVPLKTRHGGGLTEGYVCIRKDGQFGRLKELGTVKQLEQRQREAADGFQETEDTETEGFVER